MALWICAGCSAAFAVGLPACPQCLSTDYHEEGTMPKITVHGGPSNAHDDDQTAWVGEPGPELIPLPDGDPVSPADPEEEPSPGNSSATSSAKAPRSTKTSSRATASPAPTTANPS